MPTRDRAVIGAPCWIELFTSDPAATTAFYGELFGLDFADPDPDMGGYFNGELGGRLVTGGMVNDGAAGAPDGWSLYLAVDDVERAAEACAANGGTVVVAPMDIMDIGRMAVFLDPGGAMISAWQPLTHHGFQVYGEPGTPTWFELQTRDIDRDVAFYEAVFASSIEAGEGGPGFRYSMVVVDGEQLAGFMDASGFPEDAPMGWSIYFGTTDAAASTATIESRGGAVTIGPDDTPWGVLVGADDPTGISFKLQQPPAG